MTACPACAEMIRTAAIKCRYCREWIEPPADASTEIRAQWATAVRERRVVSTRVPRGDVVVIN